VDQPIEIVFEEILVKKTKGYFTCDTQIRRSLAGS
jgi:hypothetical protein